MVWEFKETLDGALAKEASGLKQVKAPTGVSFVKVNFDAKIEKPALADPLLRKDFEDAAQDTIARFVEFVGLKMMKATEQAVQKLLDANKPAEVAAAKKKMNADIEQMRGSAQQFGVMQVNKAWDDRRRERGAEHRRHGQVGCRDRHGVGRRGDGKLNGIVVGNHKLSKQMEVMKAGMSVPSSIDRVAKVALEGSFLE